MPEQDQRSMIFTGTQEEMERIENLLGKSGRAIVESENSITGGFEDGPRILRQVADHLGLRPEETKDWTELECNDQDHLVSMAAGNLGWVIDDAIDGDTIEFFMEEEPELRTRIART